MQTATTMYYGYKAIVDISYSTDAFLSSDIIKFDQ